MNLKLLAASLFAICCITAPAFAQKSPLKDGSYVCRNKGQVTGSFEVTGP